MTKTTFLGILVVAIASIGLVSIMDNAYAVPPENANAGGATNYKLSVDAESTYVYDYITNAYDYGSEGSFSANLLLKGDHSAKLNSVSADVVNPLGDYTISASGGDCYYYEYSYDAEYYGSQLVCNVDGIAKSDGETSPAFGQFYTSTYYYYGTNYDTWSIYVTVPADDGVKQVSAQGYMSLLP